MRTFFFGCMLAASSSALTLLDQNDDALHDLVSLTQSDLDLEYEDEDNDLNFFSQAGAHKTKTKDTGSQWSNDSGLVKTTFAIPEKNCCVFYSGKNFKGHRSRPLCYDQKTKNPVTRRIPQKEIMSVDCGSETFANISGSRDEDAKFSGTAGRVQVSKYVTDRSTETWVRVGYYDMAEKAAILIFPDVNCELMPKRFYWDPEDDNGSQYNEADLTQ